MMTTVLRRRTALAVPGILALTLSACVAERPSSSRTVDPKDALVGISMPTKSLERWNRDGANLDGLLQDAGFSTTIQYADNKIDQQISQIQNMITAGVNALVIAPIDGTVLAPVIQAAKAAEIPTIAYDRLIEGTADLDYYVSFDNRRVGTLQGEFIVEQLGLGQGGQSKNIELFGGSPDDPNAAQFFGGAWDVLAPHFESGELVSPSGKVPADASGWQQIGILGWDSAKAQSEMQTRLNSFYTGGAALDAVLSPNDSLALGIEQALEARGFSPGENWPLVTGQDADRANVVNMIAGKQAMTVWKDVRELGQRAALMVEQILTGAEVQISEGAEYNNGAKEVPTFLLEPKVVTADSVQEDLVDSGFYTADEVGL